MTRCSVVFLVFASVSAAPDAALALGTVGKAVRVAEATPIYRRNFRLEEGRTYTFEARVDSSRSPGGDVTIHLWHSGSLVPFRVGMGEVARASICADTWVASDACLTYTVPTRGGGSHTLIVRATRNDTPGYAAILKDGRFVDDTLANRVPFGGRRIFLEQSGRAEMEISTVLVPGGTPDTYLLLLSGEQLVAFDDDSGVGLASHRRLGVDVPQLRAVVGVNSDVQVGAARLIANDWRWNDDDRDGLGISLEGRALGTCRDQHAVLAATTWGGVDWRCNTIPDPADTDEDGIRDDKEVFGIFERRTDPAVLLPRWGADPRHKDLFLETDWCENDPRDQIVTRRDPCPANPKLEPDLARIVVNIYADLPQASIQNPDGRDGVAVHIDTGANPTDTADVTSWGAWGGATCIPRVSGACRQDVTMRTHMAANRQGVFHYAYLEHWGGGGQVRGDRAFQSGSNANVVAHELGHTVWLSDMGPHDAIQPWVAGREEDLRDAIMCKPHYVSIMNYAYAYQPYGFSEGAFAGVILNRQAVDEAAGLGTGTSASVQFLRDVFGYHVEPDGAVDWNRDGRIGREGWPGGDPRLRTVQSPLIVGRSSACCQLAWPGRQTVLEGTVVDGNISTTPAVVEYERRSYLFYVRDGRLIYRSTATTPDRCGARWDATDCQSWSAESVLAGARGLPVQAVAAEVFRLTEGARIVVVWQDSSGDLRWGRLSRSAGTDSFVEATGLLASGLPRTDLELEAYGGRVHLVFLRGGDPAPLATRRLGVDGTWTALADMRDETGTTIEVARTGIGLAAGRRSNRDELLLAVTRRSAALRDVVQFHVYDETADRWRRDTTRMTYVLETTTKPSLGFKHAGPRHRNGGWYMLAYREYRDLHQHGVIAVRMTDGDGVFSDAVPSADLLNCWVHIPAHPLVGVAFGRRAAGWTLGAAAVLTDAETDTERDLTFLPYADGIVETRARDHDDARGIRRGLCYSKYDDYATSLARCACPVCFMAWPPVPPAPPPVVCP